MQRPFNSNPEGMARNITPGPKHVSTDIPVKPGMVRQTKGDLHPYLHGQALDDEQNSKVPDKSGAAIPEHPGMSHPTMSRENRAKTGDAGAVLRNASRLGRPPEDE